MSNCRETRDIEDLILLFSMLNNRKHPMQSFLPRTRIVSQLLRSWILTNFSEYHGYSIIK
jgi:hypothetical protein